MSDQQLAVIPEVKVGDDLSEFERIFGPGKPDSTFRGQPLDDLLGTMIVNRVVCHDIVTAMEKDSIESFMSGVTTGYTDPHLAKHLFDRIMLHFKTALIMGYLVGRRDGVTLGEIPPFPEDDIHE